MTFYLPKGGFQESEAAS